MTALLLAHLPDLGLDLLVRDYGDGGPLTACVRPGDGDTAVAWGSEVELAGVPVGEVAS